MKIATLGAAVEGGRFNRVGVEALYLAQASQTALEVYAHDSLLVPPGTLASYVVSVGVVVDLSGGYGPNLSHNFRDGGGACPINCRRNVNCCPHLTIVTQWESKNAGTAA